MVLYFYPPHGGEEYVDIELILGRLVLFWSDRRKPHEVLPVHTTRYAITLWFFEEKRKSRRILTIEKAKGGGESKQNVPKQYEESRLRSCKPGRHNWVCISANTYVWDVHICFNKCSIVNAFKAISVGCILKVVYYNIP